MTLEELVAGWDIQSYWAKELTPDFVEDDNSDESGDEPTEESDEEN